jgi:SAM-dependent methyltransferase
MSSSFCSVCHTQLQDPDAAGVSCPSCGRTFPNRDGVVDFTPIPPPDSDVQERWPLWEQLQHNFVVAATEIPEHSLSLGNRPDARAFAEFSNLEGDVLDIGCGTQREPSYAVGAGVRFVGIDPVRGERERAFTFMQGLGEYLPFAEGSFDRVLFATSLDHVLSPVRALSESRRVLRATGSVNVWFGEVDKLEEPPSLWSRVVNVATHPRAVARDLAGPLRSKSPAYARELDVPEGAIDMFHVVHLSRPLVSEWLAAAGLTVTDAGRYGANVFLRAGPS